MKKVGILFGQESTFPPAFIDRINAKGARRGPRRTGAHRQGHPGRAVRLRRRHRPHLAGRAVLSRLAQERRAHRHRGRQQSVLVERGREIFQQRAGHEDRRRACRRRCCCPRTITRRTPTADSFRNLAYPLDWQGIFDYVGFPAYFKPFAGGGWKNVYKLHNPDEFFRAYNETGQLVMMLQEEVVFEQYFRCYCIDQRNVRIMPYEPRNPVSSALSGRLRHAAANCSQRIERDVLTLNQYLGYDFNTVEFAVRDGVPLAIDFCNPAPDADVNSVGQENFEWVVEAAADMAIRKAREHVPGRNNLSWGKFVQTRRRAGFGLSARSRADAEDHTP